MLLLLIVPIPLPDCLSACLSSMFPPPLSPYLWTCPPGQPPPPPPGEGDLFPATPRNRWCSVSPGLLAGVPVGASLQAPNAMEQASNSCCPSWGWAAWQSWHCLCLSPQSPPTPSLLVSEPVLLGSLLALQSGISRRRRYWKRKEASTSLD